MERAAEPVAEPAAGRVVGLRALRIVLIALCGVCAVGIVLVAVFLAGMLADF